MHDQHRWRGDKETRMHYQHQGQYGIKTKGMGGAQQVQLLPYENLTTEKAL